MASERQYAYYIEGNRIAIVEKDVSFSNNVDNKEFGPGVARQEWKSPTASATDGLELKYTNAPGDDLEDESSEIDLPSYLTKGLVYYIKARLAEDGGNIEGKEYFMREYKKILERHESSKIRGVRIISSGSHAIR
jgi:hypothetical protein